MVQVPKVKQETLVKKEEDLIEIKCDYQTKIEENSSQKNTKIEESCDINLSSSQDVNIECIKTEYEAELVKIEHQEQIEELKNDTTKVEHVVEFVNFCENLKTEYSEESVLNQSIISEEIEGPSIEPEKKPLTKGQKLTPEKREKTRERVRLLYEKNKERERQRQREYRAKNKDKINENMREKRKRNKEQ